MPICGKQPWAFPSFWLTKPSGTRDGVGPTDVKHAVEHGYTNGPMISLNEAARITLTHGPDEVKYEPETAGAKKINGMTIFWVKFD
jgi:hypothetical protein